MGRMYSAVFEEVSVSVAQDLFEINAASDSPVIVHSCVITQSSDAGDAEAEQLNVLFHRGSTSGSGGSSVTAAPLDSGDAAFGGTVEANNTTQGTEGTRVHAECFNVAVGLYYRPTPEERIIIPGGGRLIVELQTAPADALTVSGTVIFEEIG